MLAIIVAAMLQQAAGQVVWEAPPTPPPSASLVVPPIPDSARADPYGYERSECSPLVRKPSETLDACQSRVRAALSANLGAALPAGLAPAGAPDQCRQEAAGDRYALQCGAPTRPALASVRPQEQTCETRPQARAQGGIAWTEECRPADGRGSAQDGLRIRLGDDD